jgi:DNA adenine methylase
LTTTDTLPRPSLIASPKPKPQSHVGTLGGLNCLSYHGGKKQLISTIARFEPAHRLFCEPFVGGGAYFWHKPLARKNIINDTYNDLANYYFCVQNHFEPLHALVQASTHSRNLFDEARAILAGEQAATRVESAWAFWYCTNNSFMKVLDCFSTRRGLATVCSMVLDNKKLDFTADLRDKMRVTTLESRDALETIAFHDNEEAWFFVDPPYIGTTGKHYAGYTADDFRKLLALLSTMKGKFLLTSYPNEVLSEAITAYGFNLHEVVMTKSSSTYNAGNIVKKTECLVYNYPPPHSLSLDFG